MPTIATKRRLTYVTIGIFFLLGGIEYAVILPSLWLYLSIRFNASSHFLGLVMSAFSVADILASPLIGRWSDKTGNTRLIVLVANIPQFVGSVMYFIGLSPWFLVASRFVVGLGSGAGGALLADIARVTTQEERTSVYSIIMSCRQIGLLLGPACNLFLMQINFNIGPFPVDAYSVPGLFLAVLWIIHELLTIFMFWNLPSLHVQEQVEQSGALPHGSSEYQIPDGEEVSMRYESLPFPNDGLKDIRDEVGHLLSAEELEPPPSARILLSAAIMASDVSSTELTSSNDYMEVAEQYMGGAVPRRLNSVPDCVSVAEIVADPSTRPSSAGATAPLRQSFHSQGNRTVSLSNPNQHNNTTERPNGDGVLTNTDTNPVATVQQRNMNKLSLYYYISEFLRDKIIAILATVFVAFFNQVSLETMVTPLTNSLLGWKELENSILYFGAAIEIILVFVIVMPLSRRILDRSLMLFGLLLETAAIAFFLYFLPLAKPMDIRKNLPVLLVGIFIDLVGMPLLFVTSTSLYSKMTRPETQGVAQGLRRVFAQLGTILGPLWAGSMIDRPYWMFSVMIGVNLFATCLLLLTFNRLVENPPRVDRVNAASDETQPLLS